MREPKQTSGKALFRARAIQTPGTAVDHPTSRARWLAQLADRGGRFRAEALYAELDVLRTLRPQAKAAQMKESFHNLRAASASSAR